MKFCSAWCTENKTTPQIARVDITRAISASLSLVKNLSAHDRICCQFAASQWVTWRKTTELARVSITSFAERHPRTSLTHRRPSRSKALQETTSASRPEEGSLQLEKARENVGDLAKDDFDLLIYALYPTTGEQFLKWKYGLEEKPPEVQPKTLEDIRKEDEAMAAAIEQVCKTA